MPWYISLTIRIANSNENLFEITHYYRNLSVVDKQADITAICSVINIFVT